MNKKEKNGISLKLKKFLLKLNFSLFSNKGINFGKKRVIKKKCFKNLKFKILGILKHTLKKYDENYKNGRRFPFWWGLK